MENEHRSHLQVGDPTPSPLYRTFVVRCWLEPREAPAWRFALLEVGSTNARQGFTRPEEVATFLRETMTSMEAAMRAAAEGE